jgi:hypothetical protein
MLLSVVMQGEGISQQQLHPSVALNHSIALQLCETLGKAY